ncbi:MAG: U32 family peptidase [Clostridia bacterium]|nr:U32 family peptidase [Clostridia bacterium]
MPDKNYEILAPAGSYESLVCAVRSGADAVYFGLKDFSARRNAGNFTVEEMEKGVKYARKNAVKTYLALNIAVKEKELPEAFMLAKKAYFAGVDGFILSDLGLARIIKESMPDIELHASTQMTVNSPAALPILKKLGFCRVVPAREMSKEQLAVFCNEAEKLGIEVEVFIHGALCMCLSGQCLMSSVLGGRSGNRGLCAGPCRLPFSVEGGTGYDLSLKDLSLLDHIDELIKMGVYSFKIEGRMKRPEYIAAAVTSCKTAAEKGDLDSKTKDVLEDVFSRSGFTDGYYTGRLGRDMFGVRKETDIEKSKKTYAVLHDLYRNEYSRIPVTVTAEIKKDRPLKIAISSSGIKAEAVGEMPESAKTKSLSEEDVKNLLSRFGGTPYFAEKIEVSLDEGLFVPSGEINRLRRICCEKSDEIAQRPPERRFIEKAVTEEYENRETTPVIYAAFSKASQIPEALNGVDLLNLPLAECEKAKGLTVERSVSLPKFIDNEEKLVSRLEKLKKQGVKKAVCATLPAIALAKKCEMEIIGDIGLNVLNHENGKVLADIGLSEMTLSAEIDLRVAARYKTNLKKGVFAYGKLPLMAVKNCPVKNGKSCDECNKSGKITDRLGIEFPIICRDGYSEIFNSKPLYLADKSEAFSGLDFILLSFSDEDKAECRRMIDAYMSRAAAQGDFTRGLYFKEVM